MGSWLDKVQTDYVIVTGDGVSYTPQYFIASVNRSKDYNVSKYEFVGISGSFVDRRLPMGIEYDIEILFQGANNLDNAQAFYLSADNRKAWMVTHPQYGTLYVQPMGLKQNNGEYNLTRITGTIIETLHKKAVSAPVTAPADKITADAATTNTALATTYANNVPDVKTIDLKSITASVNAWFAKIKNSITNAVDYQAYINDYNAVNTLVNNTVFDSLTLIGTVQAMISAPATFADTVVNRIGMLQAQLDETGAALAVALLDTVNVLTPGQKKLYENNGGSFIAALCVASVTNITTSDYNSRADVTAIIQILIAEYNSYLKNLDACQTLNGAEPNSYIPNPDALIELDSLLNFTLGNLFDIANSAKQQRTYMLTQDSNIILLANKLLVLVDDDSTIDNLIQWNNICGYQLFQIKKGTEIIYYV